MHTWRTPNWLGPYRVSERDNFCITMDNLLVILDICTYIIIQKRKIDISNQPSAIF